MYSGGIEQDEQPIEENEQREKEGIGVTAGLGLKRMNNVRRRESE